MKTRRKLVLTVVLLLISAYMIQAAAISLRLRSIVQSSFDNFGEANPCADSVSDELYAKMCFRNGYLISAKDSPGAKDRSFVFGPIAWYWFVGGRAVYWYSYEIYGEDGAIVGGSLHVPVTVDYTLTGGKMHITSYYEPP